MKYFLEFNSGEYDRSKPLNYTLAFNNENIKMNYKSFELSFPKLDNANINFSLDSSSYPVIELCGSVTSTDGKNVTKNIYVNKIEMLDQNFGVIESTATIENSNRLIISFDIARVDAAYYIYMKIL